MFIQTETTPNPATIKFIPGIPVMGSTAPLSINSAEEAKEQSPLAEALFAIDRVKAVFLGSDFVSVTKVDDASWDTLKVEVLTTIMDHFVAGKPVTAKQGEAGASSGQQAGEADSELAKQIIELIETRVRPAVAQDGGDITFRRFDTDTGIVYLEMHGACSGCPSATATLKHGIENMLKHYIPEITAVEAE